MIGMLFQTNKLISCHFMYKIARYKDSSDEEDTQPRKKRIVIFNDTKELEYKKSIRGTAVEDLLVALPNPMNKSSETTLTEIQTESAIASMDSDEIGVGENVPLFTLPTANTKAMIKETSKSRSKPAVGPLKPPVLTPKPSSISNGGPSSRVEDNSELVLFPNLGSTSRQRCP